MKDEGGDNWVPLENIAATAGLRHEWILRRRHRPRAPHFKGCPLPKHKPNSAEQNAKITMTYFHPWTLRGEAWSDEHVPTLQNLKQGCDIGETALTEFFYSPWEGGRSPRGLKGRGEGGEREGFSKRFPPVLK